MKEKTNQILIQVVHAAIVHLQLYLQPVHENCQRNLMCLHLHPFTYKTMCMNINGWSISNDCTYLRKTSWTWSRNGSNRRLLSSLCIWTGFASWFKLGSAIVLIYTSNARQINRYHLSWNTNFTAWSVTSTCLLFTKYQRYPPAWVTVRKCKNSLSEKKLWKLPFCSVVRVFKIQSRIIEISLWLWTGFVKKRKNPDESRKSDIFIFISAHFITYSKINLVNNHRWWQTSYLFKGAKTIEVRPTIGSNKYLGLICFCGLLLNIENAFFNIWNIHLLGSHGMAKECKALGNVLIHRTYLPMEENGHLKWVNLE